MLTVRLQTSIFHFQRVSLFELSGVTIVLVFTTLLVESGLNTFPGTGKVMHVIYLRN